MKKVLTLVTVALMLVACNRNNAEKESEKQAEIQSAMDAAIDSVNAINDRERLVDSMNRASEATAANNKAAEPIKAVSHHGTKKSPETPVTGTKTEPAKTGTPAGTNTTVVSNPETKGAENNTVSTEPASTGKDEPVAEEKKKKGLNNAAKGAIIGAGAGAIGGAIINKENRGKGAIIGGAVGAGAGAVTGVILDKRKKKKAAEEDSTSRPTTTKEPAPRK
jgi:hypothetical protein